MEDKQPLLGRSSSPPPYEAQAYPRHRPRRMFIRGLLSIRVALTFILTVAVLFLCYTTSDPARFNEGRERYPASSRARVLGQFDEALAQCEGIDKHLTRPNPQSRRSNSRWTSTNGQSKPIVLRNALLFDGESFSSDLVDISFSKGLIDSVVPASDKKEWADAIEHDLKGRYVTPGLVDMHSHHLSGMWPGTSINDDTNEMHPDTKAFTPAVRIIDALKAYDIGTTIICSGGVTTSLIIPGSANLLAGEGAPVKNVLYSGEHGEPVVEDVLLERGMPIEERHRYMKMAYGENPKTVWGYSRLGTAWHLREHLQKAKDLKGKQDDYCAAIAGSSSWDEQGKTSFIEKRGKMPFELELESTIGVLRGQVIVQNHNYEPQDMETMLRISHEFGFRVRGFHHAIEAWQVPEMLKEQGDNVTIATFAEFSLYKWEAYSPNLYAGKILNEHGVPIAYKSDHSGGWLSAKYLASQAAVGHAFHLPEDKALQAITSIPAKAIDLDYRVGYCRPGYDADIAVWDSHPLSLGATPLQVFVDGQPQLKDSDVERSMGTTFTAEKARGAAEVQPQVRFEPEDTERTETCSRAEAKDASFIISGIQKAFVDNYPELAASIKDAPEEPLELVIDHGNVACLGPAAACADRVASLEAASDNVVRISLKNGHVSPGLTAVTMGLGMREIMALEETGDGEASTQKIGDPESVTYAKHGVWLDGKTFARARLGGVTRAISPPTADMSGLVHGISVEILTSGKKSLVNGGVVKEDVALHMVLGDATRFSEGTISNAMMHIRKMLKDGQGKNNATVYGRVAAGDLPLVVYANNKYDMEQLVLVKKDFPETDIVIMGGKEASFVAEELAAADIPLILTQDRPSPDVFRDKDAIIGPPLSRTVSSYLVDAGVKFAMAVETYPMRSDYRIHDLGPDAGWAAKYSGLSKGEAMALVTSKVESILGLAPSKDLVVFEGDPLRFGAAVVLAFHADDKMGKVEVGTCFPREDTGR